MDIAGLVVQVIVGAVPIGVAILSYRAAAEAARRSEAATIAAAERQAEIERTKVDAEAFQRAKQIYESALERLQTQLDQVQAECDRLNTELAQERETSQRLREQIARLERTVAALRRQLVGAGITPAAGEASEGG